MNCYNDTFNDHSIVEIDEYTIGVLDRNGYLLEDFAGCERYTLARRFIEELE